MAEMLGSICLVEAFEGGVGDEDDKVLSWASLAFSQFVNPSTIASSRLTQLSFPNLQNPLWMRKTISVPS